MAGDMQHHFCQLDLIRKDAFVLRIDHRFAPLIMQVLSSRLFFFLFDRASFKIGL